MLPRPTLPLPTLANPMLTMVMKLPPLKANNGPTGDHRRCPGDTNAGVPSGSVLVL